MLELFLSESYRLRKLASRLGAEYVDLRSDINISRAMRTQLHIFKEKLSAQASRFTEVNKLARAAYIHGTNSDAAIAEMYDAEYGGSEGSHYAYLSALLAGEGFAAITGLQPQEAAELTIVDIGAGSNELLRFCRDVLGVPSEQLTGTDISSASVALIKRDGFCAYMGRLEHIPLQAENFDATFLSYFIDYDTDQKSTFSESLRITKYGGRIILEGLFPVRPLGLFPAERTGYTFVTKGRSAAEDITLVCQAFLRMAKEQEKPLSIERIVRTNRYIYNRRGLNKLPSFFISMSVG